MKNVMWLPSVSVPDENVPPVSTTEPFVFAAAVIAAWIAAVSSVVPSPVAP